MLRRVALMSALLGAAACGCSNGERRAVTPSSAAVVAAPLPVPQVRLVAFTDLAGYLEPCGCQSVPLGGIDKAAAELDRLAADGAPALVLSVGDLFFEPVGGNAGTAHDDSGLADGSTQRRWQAETLAGVLGRMKLTAAVPGPSDLQQGADALVALAKISGTGLLGLPGSAPAATGLSPTRVVERGGVKIGLWGLSDPPLPDGDAQPAADLIAQAARLTGELRQAGAQVVIGLLRSDARLARRIAGATTGLDFVIHGGLDSADAPAPERVGDATLLRAGHHGQGLLVVDLFTGAGAGPFADRSEWTRKARATALGAEIDSLAARIAEWEKQQQEAALIAEQRTRLAGLRADKTALEAASGEKVEGRAFSARLIKLEPKVKGAATIRALLEAHDARVNDHNREAFADIAAPPVPQGQAGYVGSARCGDCHAPALAWWQTHRHGRAYATLEQRNKEFNLSCVGCHVTGYNRPGGATVVQNEGLTDVGCESCHGPGSLHVQDPKGAAVNVARAVPESTCLQCHVPEHSDRFHYDVYKAMLMAPGHGR